MQPQLSTPPHLGLLPLTCTLILLGFQGPAGRWVSAGRNGRFLGSRGVYSFVLLRGHSQLCSGNAPGGVLSGAGDEIQLPE